MLVPTPPPAFQDALARIVRERLKLAAPKRAEVALTKLPMRDLTPNRPVVQPSVCAIRLIEIPVKDGIDSGIFLKDGGATVDRSMIVSPAVPACPKGDGRPARP